MKDILDIITSTIKTDKVGGVEQCVLPPSKFKNTRGYDLFAYPSDELYKAALYYDHYINSFEIERATEVLEQIEISITIQKLANLYKQTFFKHSNSVDFLKDKNGLLDIFIALCSNFYNISEDIIRKQIENSYNTYEENWYNIVKDEDKVEPEDLYKFYNSLRFPTGSMFPINADNDLSLAYSIVPLLLVNANKCKRVFDFGGNSGEVLLTISSHCDVYECCLIEENEDALKFAKWRDNIFGLDRIKHIKESEVSNNMNEYEGKYDFGICTEVLEHVYCVEETIEMVSKLLKRGGILYFSASFGLYPEPSHLKKNIKYFGKEDELLANYNLKRIHIDSPIPLLNNIGVYVKG